MVSLFGRLHAVAKSDGWKCIPFRLMDKVKKECSYTYHRWYVSQCLSTKALAVQKNTHFTQKVKISVVIAVYNTRPCFLRELANSLLHQTYPQWEAILYDGASTSKETQKELDRIAALDERFVVIHGEKNQGISGNTNQALLRATGAYIAFCDHDDVLTLDALFEVRKAIDENHADFLYSDEDKVRGKRYYDGNLKPDFALDTIRSGNYICHLTVVSQELLKRVGLLCSTFDGCQDYDFVLRAIEKAKCVYHIPKVLYHWRMLGSSASHRGLSQCISRSSEALRQHLNRMGENATVFAEGDRQNIVYAIDGKPKLSVIFWPEDNRIVSKRQIMRLVAQTAYRPIEIVTIGKVQEDISCDVPIVCLPEIKNETMAERLNRLGRQATGRYLCFLSACLQPENPGWAEALLGQACRTATGVVTSLITDWSGSILCAGYVIGREHVAASACRGFQRFGAGYFHQHQVTHAMSAAPWQLMTTSAELWLQCGGFQTVYHKGLSDVDFCQRVRRRGKAVVFIPYSPMVCQGKLSLWDKCSNIEDETIYNLQWKNSDPYYNRQFSKRDGDYRLPMKMEKQK